MPTPNRDDLKIFLKGAEAVDAYHVRRLAQIDPLDLESDDEDEEARFASYHENSYPHPLPLAARLELSGLVMPDHVFEGYHFWNTHLGQANLTRCRFERCRFDGTFLADAEMTGCVFVGCEFILAVMPRVNLTAARFIRCTFVIDDFSMDDYVERFEEMEDSYPIYAARTNLVGANLTSAMFDGMSFDRAGVILRSAILRQANLTGCSVYQMDLDSVNVAQIKSDLSPAHWATTVNLHRAVGVSAEFLEAAVQAGYKVR